MERNAADPALVAVSDAIAMVRQQRHDFINHLQVVQGYVQLGRPQDAVDYILRVSSRLQEEGAAAQLPWADLTWVLLQQTCLARDAGVGLRIATRNVAALPPGYFPAAARLVTRVCQSAFTILQAEPDEEKTLRLLFVGQGRELKLAVSVAPVTCLERLISLLQRDAELGAVEFMRENLPMPAVHISIAEGKEE